MDLREVIMKYSELGVYIWLDPAKIRRLVGQTQLAVSA
jgi:hypothetical protein